jgi:hypothetical protein
LEFTFRVEEKQSRADHSPTMRGLGCKEISISGERPDVREFERWLEQNGYGHLLNSHTVSGARNDIQRWFNEEFKR